MDWPSLSPLQPSPPPPLCVCTELCDVPGLPPRAASGGGRRTLLRYCTLSVGKEGASKWCTDSYTIHCAASICTQQWRPFTPPPPPPPPGEVMVWSTGREGDPLQFSSGLTDLGHKEPVSQVPAVPPHPGRPSLCQYLYTVYTAGWLSHTPLLCRCAGWVPRRMSGSGIRTDCSVSAATVSFWCGAARGRAPSWQWCRATGY